MATLSENFEGTISLPFKGDWIKSTDSPHSGTYCYTNKNISDGESSVATLDVLIEVGDGAVSFYHRVSSETGYDFGKFYVDGVLKSNISGTVASVLVSYPLTEGAHTLKWEYVKDSSDSGGTDSYYIDDITITNAVDLIPVTVLVDTCRVLQLSQVINVDTLRPTYGQQVINVDTKRVLFQNITLETIGVKSITIQTGVQSLSDRFTIESVGRSFADPDTFKGSVRGFDFNFEKANTTENSSSMGTTYSVTGRPDMDDFLLSSVEFTIGSNVSYGNTRVIAATAQGLCSIIGVDASNITDFTPLGIGSLDSDTKQFKIKENSKKSLLDKLFGWTSEFGSRQIYYSNRNGVISANEVGRYTTTYDLDDVTKYTIENSSIQQQRIRKFNNTNYDEDGAPVKTPGHTTITPNYSNEPFSGTISYGDSTITYSDGLITHEESENSSTTYTFEVADSFAFNNSKKVLKSKVTLNGESKRSTTNYGYDIVRHGSDVAPDLDVSLVSEHTINEAKDAQGNWTIESQHKIYHTPLGINGFFGQRVEEIDGEDRTTVSTSISRGSPGGLASLYTTQQYNGYTVTNDAEKPPIDTFAGELRWPVNIPVADIGIVNDLIGITNSMDRKIEKIINLLVIVLPGAPLVDAIKGVLIYKGNLYYIQTTNAVISDKSTRQQITAIRWYAI